MGCERASSVRRREAGLTCWQCGRLADPPPGWHGERLCTECAPPAPYRVYMSFFLRYGWTVQFSSPKMNGSLGPLRCFRDEAAIRAFVARTPTQTSPRFLHNLETDLHRGRGALWLDLTPELYARLQTRPPRTQVRALRAH